jgi:hypothetical protein
VEKCLQLKPQTILRRTSRMFDSNSIAMLKRTSLIVCDSATARATNSASFDPPLPILKPTVAAV